MTASSPSVGDGGMSSATFDVMARLEERHWWFRAKRQLVVDALGRTRATGPAADIGCGTGAMVVDLARGGFGPARGIDADEYAIGCAESRFGVERDCRFEVGRAGVVHLPDDSLGVVCALDVIEHIDDDLSALTEFRRVLRSGGTLVVTVPAYRFLWSKHDDRLGHRRRYRRSELVATLRRAGFDVSRATYFHAWLLPIAVLVRKTPLRRFFDDGAEEASYVHPVVNAVLGSICRVERSVVSRVDLPAGMSLLAVATVPNDH